MNYGRIVLGGIVGGVAYNAVSILVNVLVLGGRYHILQTQGVFRKEPRLPFLPIYVLLLLVLSIGLVWLYAAARPRLGPGPRTALTVGLVVGSIAALPHALSQYCWSYAGGVTSLWQGIETIAGSAAATLVGAFLYREP